MMPRGVKVALGGWAAFAGTHMLMSHPPVRSKLIELSGSEYNYRLGYCAVAAATLGTAVTMYVRTPTALKGPIMHQWHRRTGLRRISGLIRAVSSVFIIDSYLTPISNPVGMLSLNSDDPTDARKLQVGLLTMHVQQRPVILLPLFTFTVVIAVMSLRLSCLPPLHLPFLIPPFPFFAAQVPGVWSATHDQTLRVLRLVALCDWHDDGPAQTR